MDVLQFARRDGSKSKKLFHIQWSDPPRMQSVVYSDGYMVVSGCERIKQLNIKRKVTANVGLDELSVDELKDWLF